MHITTCNMLTFLEACVWGGKSQQVISPNNHLYFSLVKSTNICFTDLFFYQLNFKLNVFLLENAKFPQRDPVVTYEVVPAAITMCGMILSHATSEHYTSNQHSLLSLENHSIWKNCLRGCARMSSCYWFLPQIFIHEP